MAQMSSPRSDALPPDEEKRARVQSMFDRIAPRYDLLNRAMTGGLDQRWRRLALSLVGVGPGDRVLDLACGKYLSLFVQIVLQRVRVCGLPTMAGLSDDFQLDGQSHKARVGHALQRKAAHCRGLLWPDQQQVQIVQSAECLTHRLP